MTYRILGLFRIMSDSTLVFMKVLQDQHSDGMIIFLALSCYVFVHKRVQRLTVIR